MIAPLLEACRRLVVRNEVDLARREQRRLEEGSDVERRRFLRLLRTTPGPGRVVLGRVPGNAGGWLGLPTDDLISQHGLSIGGTGGGKSFSLLSTMMQVVRDERSTLLFDGKGELSTLWREIFLPALASSEHGAGLVDRVHVVRPFDRTYVPELNIACREEGVPIPFQAQAMAATLEEALGEQLRGRMIRPLSRVCGLLIELGLPLPAALPWLRDPTAFLRAAMRSQDTAIREYARTGLPRESCATIEALIARLDSFLLMPGTEALSASRCVNIARALSSPGEMVILDPSNPPAGAERVGRFWAAALIGLASRAILTREVGPESLPVWFVAEEIQEGLTPSQSGLLGRLLSTARSRKVGLYLTTQHRSALTKVDPNLIQSITANVGLQFQFRTSLEDAKTFAHALPQSSDERKEHQLRRARIAELTRLPRRMAYLWVRSAGLRAQLIRTPRIDLDTLHEHADRLDSGLREGLRRGSSAVRRDELAPPRPVREVPWDPFGGALDHSNENGARSKDELPTLG